MGFNNVSRVKSASIERIPAGAIIDKHRVEDSGWGVLDNNTVRFRMPMRTNSLVKFSIWDHNDFQYDKIMNTGKFYYTDITKYHAEENLSDTDALYLQIDCLVNDRIRQAIC